MRLGSGALMLGLAVQFVTGTARDPTMFRFVRGVEITPGKTPRACAVLDGTVYAHAAPALADLRLFAGGADVPYALTMSETAPNRDAAKVMNLGMQGRHVVFDLEMPERAYSSVNLNLEAHDFLAAAKVTGLKSLKDAKGTSLGTFTLFDLSGQRLGRSTMAAFAESSFPFLHVELAFSSLPSRPVVPLGAAVVRGAEVPPSREAQTLYTTVAETSAIVQRGRESVAEFEVPAHVPVERVGFELAPGEKANFSRGVKIVAKARDGGRGEEAAAAEEVSGEIARIRLTEAGQEIREERLSVAATLGSDAQSAATVEVAVENGDDQPVAIRAVKLEMRQRKLCFDAPAAPVSMYYGASGVQAPMYDYSRLFSPAATAAMAQLEPETLNSGYVARTEKKGFAERHPKVLWLALLGAVAALGVVALRSARGIRG